MSLNDELERMREASWGRWPAEKRAILYRVRDEISASGLIERALKQGDRAPDFELPDVSGQCVRLREVRAHGPVVISFYRGHW
ncbi:MAG: redoxin domain-containing protein [Planctomycetes bacterium]|nr:redoxin domain-containing protein [Planctomycetota bacterium]MBI3836095.1 redoxin domain-containing protein [Planctomycetota bacterium]